MTVGSIFGILGTLGFVLALLGIVLKLLRRFSPTAGSSGRLRMEVVQRLALGSKQGIAVVRVGTRLVAVSVGDGGVNRLFEVAEDEVVLPTRVGEPAAEPAGKLDFHSLMRGALKTAGVAGFVLGAVLLPSRATAQAAARRAPSAAATNAQVNAIARNAVAAAKPGTAPADIAASLLAQRQAATSQAAATTAAASAGARVLADAPVSKLAPQMDLRVGGGSDGGLRLSGTVGVVVMMGLMTLLPTLLLMMTGFTRILIVLNFLRQALGTQGAPPTQLVAGLALLLTGFVMAPTLSEVNRTALQPWLDGKMEQAQMLDVGSRPFRAFMMRQTRRQDIETFVRMSGTAAPKTAADVPLVTLTSAFVISELRTAFQIGFALFLPFIVIDVVVSSVLMSMGMFMLPPAMISLPFKLLLFVLVDGWSLIVQSLVTSFR